MATIKAFSDLEQSKKLAEILPLGSADMAYYQWKDDGHLMSPVPFVLDGMEEKEDGVFEYIPCWSLTALLGVLPIIDLYSPSLKMKLTHKYYVEVYLHKQKRYLTTDDYDNPIDACYEMILKLHELKLL